MELINGDCLERLRELEDNSVDAIVTDVPAGIGFMNKEWDSDKGGRDEWMKWMKWMTEVFTEAKRVLKAGGHCLVWALPRTSHWTAMAIENAGFEIRDCVYHIQSQGFPKSLNVSKAIDKKFGAEREVVGRKTGGAYSVGTNNKGIGQLNTEDKNDGRITETSRGLDFGIETAPSTDKAKEYDGYGSQLKPAVECWWLIRKPLSEKNTVDNVLKHGTGAINIDKSRIPTEENLNGSGNIDFGYSKDRGYQKDYVQHTSGRFPANLIHDGSDAVMEEFNKYGNHNSTSANFPLKNENINDGWKRAAREKKQSQFGGYDDSGSVARFFYCSKASVSERNTGLDGFEEKEATPQYNSGNIGAVRSDNTVIKPAQPQKNNHPTVKSVKLMSYLVNLVMPPKGVVLDMFMGTGTTGIAALLNGYDFIGIEMSEEYMKIAQARINNYESFRKYLR